MNGAKVPTSVAANGVDRTALVLLNGVGGLLVLGSYASAFGESEAVRAALWGGVPTSWQPLYTVNMLLAAVGYLAFTWFLVVSLDRRQFEAGARAPYGVLHAAYLLVLIPSALWLPLTVRMIESPDPLLWAVIRVVLLAIGAGALCLLWLSIRLARNQPGAASFVAVAGAAPLVLQTVVLDALIWPAYFSTATS